jgi:urate oxidase
MAATLGEHQHGKSRVRVARVWKKGSGQQPTFVLVAYPPSNPPLSLGAHQLVGTPLAAVHYFVEYTVHTMLESDMAHAFLTDSNRGMTATDTQKNMVYVVAKAMQQPCSPEEFGVALAKKFVDSYPLVSKAKVAVEMAPWRRLNVNGQVSTVRFFNLPSLPTTCIPPHTFL